MAGPWPPPQRRRRTPQGFMHSTNMSKLNWATPPDPHPQPTSVKIALASALAGANSSILSPGLCMPAPLLPHSTPTPFLDNSHVMPIRAFVASFSCSLHLIYRCVPGSIPIPARAKPEDDLFISDTPAPLQPPNLAPSPSAGTNKAGRMRPKKTPATPAHLMELRF